MTVQPFIDTPLHDVLEIVRCPYCMSRLTSSFSAGEEKPPVTRQAGSPSPAGRERRAGPSAPRLGSDGPVSHGMGGEGALRCDGCGRSYPLHSVGNGSLDIPWLMRDDALATLDQDIVVSRSDPDSTRLDYRRHIEQVERRERFLAPFVSHIADRYAVPPVKGAPGRREDSRESVGETALFERFTRGLPSDGIVLDIGCDARTATRLTRLGLRVVGLDTNRARLERTMTTAASAAAEVGAHTLFVGADPLEAPFAAASVDGVWCDGAFASVRPDRRTVFFRQVNRVLRHGGLLFLGAGTASPPATLRRYLLQRYVYRWPVVYGDDIERPRRGRTGGWRYRAVMSVRAAHTLCREHGFKIVALRRAGDSLLLLARKEHGTDG